MAWPAADDRRGEGRRHAGPERALWRVPHCRVGRGLADGTRRPSRSAAPACHRGVAIDGDLVAETAGVLRAVASGRALTRHPRQVASGHRLHRPLGQPAPWCVDGRSRDRVGIGHDGRVRTTSVGAAGRLVPCGRPGHPRHAAGREELAGDPGVDGALPGEQDPGVEQAGPAARAPAFLGLRRVGDVAGRSTMAIGVLRRPRHRADVAVAVRGGRTIPAGHSLLHDDCGDRGKPPSVGVVRPESAGQAAFDFPGAVGCRSSSAPQSCGMHGRHPGSAWVGSRWRRRRLAQSPRALLTSTTRTPAVGRSSGSCRASGCLSTAARTRIRSN